MLPVYKNETMTYSEWEAIHKAIKEEGKAEKLYFLKQKLSGLVMTGLGILTPFIMDGDATPSLLFVPLGLLFMFSKEKFML